MNSRITLWLLCSLVATASGFAQEYTYASTQFAPAQLDQLLSPIALYPDPLLGAMLPASTHPADVAAAANLVSSNTDPGIIDQQPWDESVKILAHYPNVATWMAHNTEWMNQLGAAVATEQPAVLDSIQRLRANARASGLLVDTPQQRVIDVNNQISIEPAQPGTLYVPSYDPQYVETTTIAPAPITFGVGYAIGDWPVYGIDWRERSVWYDRDRSRGRDWARIAIAPPRSREQWRPSRTQQPWNETHRIQSTRAPRPTPFAEHATGWRDTPARVPTGWANRPAVENHRNPAANQSERHEPRPYVEPATDARDRRHNEEEHRDGDHPADR